MRSRSLPLTPAQRSVPQANDPHAAAAVLWRRAPPVLLIALVAGLAPVTLTQDAPGALGPEARVGGELEAPPIQKRERFKKALELSELRILAQLVSEPHRASILDAARVAPSEVRRYYEAHRHELTVAPHFTAHHLLVYVEGNPAFPEKGRRDGDARARAEEALARLRAGGSWEAVAQTYSDEPAATQRGGLIREAEFGHFAPEVERAIRTQALGQPGPVVRSAFGYHVLEVVERVTDRVPRPFEEVEKMLTDRLTEERLSAAREAFMAPIREEIGLELTEAGQRDGPLSDARRVQSGEIIARVGGKDVSEAEFRWFVEDALLPEQRVTADSRPGARRGMLRSYLDMRVLEAKAKREGLDRSADFAERRDLVRKNLLAEFSRPSCLAPGHR